MITHPNPIICRAVDSYRTALDSRLSMETETDADVRKAEEDRVQYAHDCLVMALARFVGEDADLLVFARQYSTDGDDVIVCARIVADWHVARANPFRDAR